MIREIADVVRNTPASSTTFQPMRQTRRNSHNQSAAIRAGRVGMINRHSNSHPTVNSTAMPSTRATVGRANQMLASAIAPKTMT